mmetsp:Transcript_126627/g.300843  ORF Transcript_126627/g.300843 Transcript_126627/m.300843 type:complete len:250 (-) Transcript_126627:1237-1986(-)
MSALRLRRERSALHLKRCHNWLDSVFTRVAAQHSQSLDFCEGPTPEAPRRQSLLAESKRSVPSQGLQRVGSHREHRCPHFHHPGRCDHWAHCRHGAPWRCIHPCPRSHRGYRRGHTWHPGAQPPKGRPQLRGGCRLRHRHRAAARIHGTRQHEAVAAAFSSANPPRCIQVFRLGRGSRARLLSRAHLLLDLLALRLALLGAVRDTADLVENRLGVGLSEGGLPLEALGATGLQIGDLLETLRVQLLLQR